MADPLDKLNAEIDRSEEKFLQEWMADIKQAGRRQTKPPDKSGAQRSTPPRPQAGEGERSPEEILKYAKQVLLGGKFDLPDYPVEGLWLLASVAEAIAEHGQCDIALAGQSVLAAAALCAQAHANVETLAGTVPITLYQLTIGESGDGKTTAESAALRAIREYERKESSRYQAALEAYKKSKEEGKAPPIPPYLLMSDATIEGLRRSFFEGRPSQGMVTSEGATVFSGYGMKKEHQAKTAGEFNRLWDDGEISVSRATSGRLQLYHRRFSMHLMIQPAAVQEALMNALLTDIGLWPRFLLAWPQPAKPRKARLFRPSSIPEIKHFWERCKALLPATDCAECSDLPRLKLTEDAHELLGRFFEGMEVEAKSRRGRYVESCRPFALRATEQACRVAGVLAVYADRQVIDAELITCGIKMALYSVESWRAAFNDREQRATAETAYRYLKWMVQRRKGAATETDMLRNGPKPRGVEHRDTAISVLHAAGLIFLANETKPWTWVVSNSI